MAIPLILFSTIIASSFVSITVSENLVYPINYQTLSFCSDQSSHNSLARQVEEANLKLARLESILDDRTAEVDSKTRHLRDCEKKIEELTAEIDRLKTAVSSFEHDYSRANLRLSALEEEVRLLWAASRKHNFEIHALKYKALDAESRLKEVTSQVEEMNEIVSEQCIQIQQLEQALHMAEKRTSKIRNELWGRCPFVKFFVTLFSDRLETLKGIPDPYVSRDGTMLVFFKSQALHTFRAARHYHHKLQGFIRHAMQNNELTAAFAHQEVVFFVASALVAFPLMSACMLFLSQFS
ncbi:hypothetical protein OROHE_010334 [Orobanche hederae]